jgi:hypothetical protein
MAMPSCAQAQELNFPDALVFPEVEVAEEEKERDYRYLNRPAGQQAQAHQEPKKIKASGDSAYPAFNIDLSLLPGDFSHDSDKTNVAQAGSKESGGDPAKCAALAADLDADIGVMIRAGCKPTLAQMSKLMDNPLGNVAMLFTQFDISQLENKANGREEMQYLYTGIAQFPKKLSKDWNLINRVVWTVPSPPIDEGRLSEFSSQGGAVVPPSNPGLAPIDAFSGRTTGFGDMYYVGLFAPEKGIDVGGGEKFLWGAGFDLSFPTASTEILGSGRWSAGPSALGVYMGKKWKVGGLVQQYWDYAGDSGRDAVNLTNLQYFLFYSLDETTAIGASPNIIANWEQNSDNAFTVPVGIGIVKTFQIGKVPIRFGIEYHHSVVQPDTAAGTDWNVRFYIIPAIPSALFSWMQ